MRALFAASTAALGGALWVVKGASILVSGVQPPWLFELAPVFFAASCWGLASTRGDRALSAGALCAAVLAVVLLMVDAAAAGGAFLGVAMLGVIAFLLVFGWRVRRRWRAPLVLGVSIVPLVVVGGLLAIVHERLLEVPLVLLGLGWIALGGVALRRRDNA